MQHYIVERRKPIMVLLGICLFLAIGRHIIDVLAFTDLPVGFDARSYIAAAKALRMGYSPYDDETWKHVVLEAHTAKYLYPPLLAVICIPLSFLPFLTASYIAVGISALAALILAVLFQQQIGWKLAVIAVLAFPPTWFTIYLGQVNGWIALLLLIAFIDIQRGGQKAAGLALAIGTLFKITPILTLYVLARKRHYAGGMFSITTAVLIVLATLPIVRPQWWFEGGLAAVSFTYPSPDYTSWTGILSNFGMAGERAGGVLIGLFLTITLIRIPRVPTPLGLAAMTLLPLLIARVSWEHHAVVALPALLLLAQHSAAGKYAAIATWVMIAVFGHMVIPVMITLCWLVCCFPNVVDLFASKTRLSAT